MLQRELVVACATSQPGGLGRLLSRAAVSFLVGHEEKRYDRGVRAFTTVEFGAGIESGRFQGGYCQRMASSDDRIWARSHARLDGQSPVAVRAHGDWAPV